MDCKLIVDNNQTTIQSKLIMLQDHSKSQFNKNKRHKYKI